MSQKIIENSITMGEAITQLDRVLTIDKKAKKNFTPYLWGAAGIGKTSIVEQAAKKHGYECRLISLNTLSPIDVRGVPYIDKDESGNDAQRFRFIPPEFMPTGREDKPVLLFFDEINTAVPTNQVVAYQIALERKMGGHDLPENTLVVLAGNRDEDRGATMPIPMPLANRLCHLFIEPDKRSFSKWAMNSNINSSIIAFINKNDDLLHKMENNPAFPSPRTWEFLSVYMDEYPNASTKEIASFVGSYAAGMYQTFLELKNKLPDVDAILENGVIPPKFRDHNEDDFGLQMFYITTLTNQLIHKLNLRFENVEFDSQHDNILYNYIKGIRLVNEETQAYNIYYLMDYIPLVQYLSNPQKFPDFQTDIDNIMNVLDDGDND